MVREDGPDEGLLSPLAAAVRSGRIRATALIEAALKRIEAARALNAVVAVRADEALADARRLDQAVARGGDPGPLAGLPLLVKDIEDAAGLPTTFGSRLYEDAQPAAFDGIAAHRLRAAGAILVGKTNVPEFAFEGYTANPLFGSTGNPWSLQHSPGGSSGGSGAALAAGLVSIATATDVGGSVRIPASLCGLVGLKPTAGLIGRDQILASLDLNSHGVLASTVADVRLLLGLLAGPTAGDVGALPRLPPLDLGRPTRLVVAAAFTAGVTPSPAVTAAFATAVEQVAAVVGLSAQEVGPERLFPSGYDPDDWFRIVGVEQAFALGPETIKRNSDRLDPVFRREMLAALDIPIEEYAGARRRRFRLAAELDALLGEAGLLMTPTLNVDGWLADGRLTDRDEPGLPGWVFNTEPPNLTGHPAISLPAGVLANGIPFGIQVVGPRFGDQMLLDLAELWQTAHPWPLVSPGYRPFSTELEVANLG